MAATILMAALAISTAVPLSYACEGKVTGGGQCIVGTNTKIPSASFGFNVMSSDRQGVKGELNYVDHISGMHVHMHIIDYLEVWGPEPGNKPWPFQYAFFTGPCTIDGVDGHTAKVYIEDRGEPGNNDRFQITLDDGYVGGSGAVSILAGNIQIHKPPK